MLGHYLLKLTASLAWVRKISLCSIILVRKFCTLYMAMKLCPFVMDNILLKLSYLNYLKSFANQSVLTEFSSVSS